ncbi:MAG: RoPhREQ2 gp58 [Marmoricola sp.]|nr:RoPhREQ2 gp58 [Marmoricola sp.]
MNISETTAAKSDQQNFDDYATGSRTVTIDKVTAGTAEQPVEIHLVEYPGRPYKPSKSMRRVIIAAWGPETSEYIGRRMTLVGDPTVKFGGMVVGGIKVSHLSHIDARLSVSLTIKKGVRAPHTVDALKEDPNAALILKLRAKWEAADPKDRPAIEAEVAALGGSK